MPEPGLRIPTREDIRRVIEAGGDTSSPATPPSAQATRTARRDRARDDRDPAMPAPKAVTGIAKETHHD